MQRPTAVTVFGVLNIVFGAFGILCKPLSMVRLYTSSGSGNRLLNTMREYPVFRAWMLTSIVLNVIAAVVLLAMGIGLLRLRPWAWKASVGYSIYAIVVALVSVGFLYAYMMIPSVGAVRGAIGALVAACMGLTYPVLLIVFMTQQHVRSAFVNVGMDASMATAPPSL